MKRLAYWLLTAAIAPGAACSIVNAPADVQPGSDGAGGEVGSGGDGSTSTTGAEGGNPTTTSSGGSGGTGGAPDPVCGNGAVEGVEECDDGALDEGDACSANCTITEFDVEADATVGNEWPGVAISGVDGGKGFFVVWRFLQMNANEIRGRAYKANGERVTNQAIKLSSNSMPGQARIGNNGQGRSIVSWQGDPAENLAVRYRVIEPNGTPLDATDKVLGSRADSLITVGASDSGDFALMWLNFDGMTTRAYLRSFNSGGSSFNTFTQLMGTASGTGFGIYPGVWGIKDGFAASWNTFGGNLGSFELDSFGVSIGAQFDLATGGSDAQPNRNPSGTYVGPADQFIAVYEGPTTIGPDTKVRVKKRRFNAPGMSAESGIEVSSNHHQERESRVARHPNGRFVVVWTDMEGAEGNCNVLARVFAADGNALAPEFQVNQVTPGCQSWPGVAVNEDGDAMFVWDNYEFFPFRISSVIYPRLLTQ